MTVRGQKNHFNVKFLKGYGCAVNLKDNQVTLKNGLSPFSDSREVETFYVTKIPYRKIILSGKGYVSTEAVKLLTEKNIQLLITDTYGNPLSFMSHIMNSETSTRYRMGQYDTFRDESKKIQLQKKVSIDKIDAQVRLLRRIDADPQTIRKLSKYRSSIESKTTTRELLTLESRVGHIYFNEYTRHFHADYEFVSRHGMGLRMTNQNAGDIVNSLLNYGFTVLAGEITKFVNSLGLDAYFGFYHKSHTSFQALVYDLIEPFRPLVEYAVFKFCQRNQARYPKKREYAHTKDGIVIMETALITRFLEKLERVFQEERPFKIKAGVKRSDGTSMCQEITIAKTYVQELADFCTC
jgi:CRISPR-associated protein Cas1